VNLLGSAFVLINPTMWNSIFKNEPGLIAVVIFVAIPWCCCSMCCVAIYNVLLCFSCFFQNKQATVVAKNKESASFCIGHSTFLSKYDKLLHDNFLYKLYTRITSWFSDGNRQNSKKFGDQVDSEIYITERFLSTLDSEVIIGKTMENVKVEEIV
jgi:hypothetical protein